jgi:Flp pilus assembly pilin Flp
VKKGNKKMKTVKEYIKRLIRDEDGAELIQFAIIVAIAAVLAVAVLAVSNVAKGKMDEAKGLIEDIDVKGTVSPETPEA